MAKTTSPGGWISGGCLCGAVRFTADPNGRRFGVCHCSMCRRWTAGVFFAVECEDRVRIEDETYLGVYRSSGWAERGFCQKCGTPLFYRMTGQGYYAVSLEALDDREGFTFVNQIFIDDKPPYYDFANATRTMTGADVAAAFAPPGENGGA